MPIAGCVGCMFASSQLRTNESGEAKLVSVLDLLICCWVRLEFSLGIGLWDGGWEWCFFKGAGWSMLPRLIVVVLIV